MQVDQAARGSPDAAKDALLDVGGHREMMSPSGGCRGWGDKHTSPNRTPLPQAAPWLINTQCQIIEDGSLQQEEERYKVSVWLLC